MSEETVKETVKETQVLEIKPSDVIKMLEQGMDRKAIGKHYGLNRTNTNALFADSRLKGRKTKNAGGTTFVLADDGTKPLEHKSKKASAGSTEDAEATDGVDSEAQKESAVEEKIAVTNESKW